jgi:hypothetical protein
MGENKVGKKRRARRTTRSQFFAATIPDPASCIMVVCILTLRTFDMPIEPIPSRSWSSFAFLKVAGFD